VKEENISHIKAQNEAAEANTKTYNKIKGDVKWIMICLSVHF
jgi:hypothetical protein